MSPDKRRKPRHLVCVLAHLAHKDTDKSSALINDLSVTGAHLYAREQLEVGDRVELAVHVEKQSPPLTTGARVVRINPRPPEMASPWTVNVAVEFDAPLPQLEALAGQLTK